MPVGQERAPWGGCRRKATERGLHRCHPSPPRQARHLSPRRGYLHYIISEIILHYTSRVNIIRLQSQRYIHEPESIQHNSQSNQQHNSVRQHEGAQRTDTGALHVLLAVKVLTSKSQMYTVLIFYYIQSRQNLCYNKQSSYICSKTNYNSKEFFS